MIGVMYDNDGEIVGYSTTPQEENNCGNIIYADIAPEMIYSYSVDLENKVLIELPDEEASTKRFSAFLTSVKQEVEMNITIMIQSEVDKYNTKFGLSFGSIDSVVKYIPYTSYTHQPFCAAIMEWNIAVWERAREIYAQVSAGEVVITTVEEMLALLPKFTFVY
jgi:hypothetical protein